MPEVCIHRSIYEIGRARWNALFPAGIETFDYLAAVEASGLAGFRWRYPVVWQDGRAVAAAPAFLLDYALDTTLAGQGRRLVAALRARLPRLLTLPMACLGSPCTESLTLGVDARADGARRGELLLQLVSGFEENAAREGASLLAIKDLTESEREVWADVLESGGYGQVGGLPVAYLDIDFPGIDSYLARLSSGTRRDMRRKLRSQSQVRIELANDISPHLDRVMELYRGTRARAPMQFEDLTSGYFQGVCAHMGANAVHVLYWRGNQLLATNLLLQGNGTLVDKFFCMDPDAGRELNLYFVSWFTNIQMCLERGLTRYQSGQAAYANKLRLGCSLLRTTMHFRHRNRVVHAMLKLAAPMLDADPVDNAA